MPTIAERIRERQRGAAPAMTPLEQTRALGTAANPDLPIAERIRERQRLREAGISAPEPQQADISTRRQFLASQVGEERLGEPGMRDLATRFDLGLSDIFEEKQVKFLEKYPDGDFVLVDEPPRTATSMGPRSGRGGKTILFRRTDSEPYAELDASMIEDFEPFGDLADLSGELPAVVIEGLVLRGAGSILQQMGRVFLGNLTGQAAKEVMEEARGFQFETFPEQASRAIPNAGFAAGGAGATSLLTGPINAVRGASLINVSPGGKAAQRAATEEGLPALMPSQVASNPLIRKLGNQAGETVAQIADYVQEQKSAAVQSMMRLRDADMQAMLRGELEELHGRAREQVLAAARRSTTDLTTGGTALREGIAEYDNLAKTLVNKLYSDARAIETPTFDITTLQRLAEEIKAGIPARKVNPDNPNETINVQPVEADLRRVLDDILSLDPDLPPTTITRANGDLEEVPATEQLRALRSRLWDMKTPAFNEIPRNRERQAGRLYGAISKVLREPVNESPEFVEAWAKANRTAEGRFDTMDQLITIQGGKSETPAKMAARLAKPLQVDNLRTLRLTLPKDKYEVFQSAAKQEMLRDPSTLRKRLETFDKPTLNALFSADDRKALREFADQWDELDRLGLDRVLQRQSQASAVMKELVERNDTAQIDQLIQRAGPDPDTSLRRSLRGGLMERVWNASTVKDRNVSVIDSAKLRSELDRLRETGAIDLLTPDDVKVLENLELYTELLPASTDTGASLQAGETTSQIRELSLTGFQTLLENMGVARLFTSPIFQRFLLGQGREPLPFNNVRLMGAVLSQAMTKDEVGAPSK